MTEEKKPEFVELEEMPVILKIPSSAALVKIEAVLLDENGETHTVAKKLDVKEIHQVRQDFLDNVPDGDEYDAKYYLTEEGKEYLKQLQERFGAEGTDDNTSNH